MLSVHNQAFAYQLSGFIEKQELLYTEKLQT